MPARKPVGRSPYSPSLSTEWRARLRSRCCPTDQRAKARSTVPTRGLDAAASSSYQPRHDALDLLSDLWIVNSPAPISLRGAKVDQRIEFQPIIAGDIWIDVDPPEARLLRPILQEEALLIRVKLAVDGHDPPLDVDDGFHHIAEHPVGHLTQAGQCDSFRDYFHAISTVKADGEPNRQESGGLAAGGTADPQKKTQQIRTPAGTLPSTTGEVKRNLVGAKNARRRGGCSSAAWRRSRGRRRRGSGCGVPRLIRQDREAFTASGVCKPLIETDERIPLRGLVTPDQRGRQLERIGRAKRVPGEKPASALAERGRRRNHVNVGHQGLESFERLSERRGRQTSLSTAPVEC